MAKNNLFRGNTASTIALSGNKEDHFYEFEKVRVPSVDDTGDAAVGWIAHSSYLGAIPKRRENPWDKGKAGQHSGGE